MKLSHIQKAFMWKGILCKLYNMAMLMSDEPLCVSYSKWKASIFSHEAVVLHFQNKQPSKTKDVGVQFSSAHKAEKEEARN